MMWPRVVPIVMLLIIALIVLVLVLHQRRKSQDTEHRERLAAEKRWTGDCEFDNPKTGAKCERKEFHLENHYHVLDDDSLTTWP